MTRMLQISALIVAGSMTLLPWIAQAQVRCAAGAAVNGDCVNEAMARSALQAAVIFSQPKISYTAYPVLPSADRPYRYPNQLMPDQLRTTPVAPGPGFEFPGGATRFPGG
ncbi:MAG: hypothetical protein ACM3IH_17310 [Sphingobacteriales bacterium]